MYVVHFIISFDYVNTLTSKFTYVVHFIIVFD